MKRRRYKIEEKEEEMAAACRSSRRRLVTVRPTVALLLLLAGGGGCGLCSPSSTCHAFAIGGHSAGNGASVGRQRSSSSGGGGGGGGGFVPLVQRLHLATLSTQDGQDEVEVADGATTRSSNARGTSLEDTSFDKSKQEPTRTTKAKAKAKAKGRGRRRPSPNKRTSLKWVVESVEACLCKEKGYQSEYSSHLEKKDGACDWQEQDLVLVDALWELCWGEFGLPIYLDSSRLFFRSALFVFAYIRLLSINAC